MGLFGKKKTPQEMLRENQRALNKSIRELDRERMNLQRQEKKIVMDIKKSAKEGQMAAAKIMAKDLVRTRGYIQKFYRMRTQLQTVSLKMQTMKSNTSMAQAMAGVTRAMHQMNSQMNMPAMQRIMFEFEKQSEMMDMKEDMMNDAIDDAVDDDLSENEDEAAELILNQVLDEANINISTQLVDTPASATPAQGSGVTDEDLQARFERLGKN
eukprot:GCRY01002721.1.p1 GENE.GCRY01002721.1~~GCRY01002721.1.p1  ORF type:complete len:212 (+),score=49.72 GCRY01002721.1:161-796(+)